MLLTLCTSKGTLSKEAKFERTQKTTRPLLSKLKGKEPVREWLLGLEEKDRKLIGADIATAEYAWPVAMPLSRPLGNGLFEIRSNLTDGRISRVIFAVVDRNMALLHGFIKKTEQTPHQELVLALKRLREIQ